MRDTNKMVTSVSCYPGDAHHGGEGYRGSMEWGHLSHPGNPSRRKGVVKGLHSARKRAGLCGFGGQDQGRKGTTSKGTLSILNFILRTMRIQRLYRTYHGK